MERTGERTMKNYLSLCAWSSSFALLEEKRSEESFTQPARRLEPSLIDHVSCIRTLIREKRSKFDLGLVHFLPDDKWVSRGNRLDIEAQRIDCRWCSSVVFLFGQPSTIGNNTDCFFAFTLFVAMLKRHSILAARSVRYVPWKERSTQVLSCSFVAEIVHLR